MVETVGVVCWERVHRCVVTDAGKAGRENRGLYQLIELCMAACVRALSQC